MGILGLMKKLIAVLGPSKVPASDPLYRDAERLGALLGTAGFAVVTGGYDGVMEGASKGAREMGAPAIGVTAEVYFARGREANAYLTREVSVKSATDRLMELLDLPDAFIAIGNSIGTLAEIAMAWDYITKEFLPSKPIVLIGKSWNGFYEYMRGEPGFAPWLHLLEYHETPELAMEALLRFFGPQRSLPELNILK
jgi:uncharacterized protein (TIGR00730 family)